MAMNNLQFAEPINQQTIKDTLRFIGTGLHTGRGVSMCIHPAEINRGIRFVRKDVALGRGVIPALWHNVADAQLCSVVANEYGVSVSTVEHVMAALRGCNVDNALIEIDGPEVPIMDGSADAFVSMIDAMGVVDQSAPRRAIQVHKSVKVHQGDKYAMLLPGHRSSFSMAIDFPDTLIGYQKYTIKLSAERFARDISRARTFGLIRQIERLLDQDLLLGGSLNNAIVVDDEVILNEDGLRFEDEFVRHKLLDSIGDLYLAGMPILGHFQGYKTGHLLNQILLLKLFSNPQTWSYVNLAEVVQTQPIGNRKSTASIAKPIGQIPLKNRSYIKHNP